MDQYILNVFLIPDSVGRYLYVFGGGSSTKCYDDLHALDLQTMTWEIPTCKVMIFCQIIVPHPPVKCLVVDLGPTLAMMPAAILRRRMGYVRTALRQLPPCAYHVVNWKLIGVLYV